MKISAKTKMCIIIGDPVEHSLSPAMHNAAYKKLGIDDEFVFTACRVSVEKISTVVEAMRVMGIRGLTCTIPHKVEIMKYLDKIDEKAKKIGAVNTVVNDNGKLIGYNTDWLGIITPLEKMMKPKGRSIAIIGAGGAARAAVFGCLEKKAQVKIFNRTVKKGKKLASEFECDAGSLDEIREVKEYDVIINTTSLGMGDKKNQSPVFKKYLNKNQIIFDAVYTPRKTKLIKDALSVGARVIYGYEMLLYQGLAQFELYTERVAQEDAMREVLEK